MRTFSSLAQTLCTVAVLGLAAPALAQTPVKGGTQLLHVQKARTTHRVGAAHRLGEAPAAPRLTTRHPLPQRITWKPDADQHQYPPMDERAAPANDNCSGAVTLTMGTTCNAVSGTVAQATQSIAAVNCNGFTGNANDDVWYKFVATASAATIDLTCNSSFDGVLDLRSGGCNGTNIDCGDNYIEGGSETIVATGLTVGSTYYVRVYDYNAGYPSDPTFTVCVYQTPAPPANDECTDATIHALSASGDQVTINGNNVGATDSEGFGFNTVWEAFTVDGCADVTVDYCGTANFNQVVTALVIGCPIADVVDSTSTADCGDGNFVIHFDGLAAGTYYVPVYEGPDAIGPYTITITSSPCGGTGTPANDECSGATVQDLPVGGSVEVNGDNTGATDSEGVGFATVWEAFSITECADVVISYCGTVGFDTELFQLTQGCPFATVIDSSAVGDCGDGNLAVLFLGLQPGTYYVPVYSDPGAQGPYTITMFAQACGTSGTPVNDQCSSVTPANLAVGSFVNFVGDNTGATMTGDYESGSQLEAAGLPSVWHAFTTTECANVTVSYCGTTPSFDNVWIVLTTDCPASDAFVVADAYDTTTCADGNFTVHFTGLPAGTYYLPVLTDEANGVAGPYTINVFAAACAAPPANDNCSGAIDLPVSTICAPTQGNDLGATQSLPAIACNGFTGSANDDVWYSFVATSPHCTVTVQGTDPFDAVAELLVGSCGSLVTLACSDTSVEGGIETIDANNLETGITYYVRVYDYYSGYPAATTFSICVTGDVGTAVAAQQTVPFVVRPNPTDGDLFLNYAGERGKVTIELFDMTGRIAYSEQDVLSTGQGIQLSLGGKVAAGTYSLRLTTASGRSEQHIMVR